MNELYYGLLDKRAQKSYIVIYDGLKSFRKNITLLGLFETEVLTKIISYVALDHPELFFVEFSRMNYNISPIGITYNPLYNYTFSEIESRKRELKVLRTNILQELSDRNLRDTYSKYRWLHNYLIKKVTYDEDAVCHSKPEAHNIYGALKNKTAVCEGIAKAFKYLCDGAELSSAVIRGRAFSSYLGETEEHAWNMVEINGNWLHVDVTYDLGMSMGVSAFRYDYFLVPDADISKDHNYSKVIDCSATGYSYFEKRNALIAGPQALRQYLQREINDRKSTICFKISTNRTITDDMASKIDKIVKTELLKQSSNGYFYARNIQQGVFYYRILKE